MFLQQFHDYLHFTKVSYATQKFANVADH